ncbi:MAG: histidine phosphatase family protein, partial [Candidatus Limnocylindria bacterium]
MGSLFLVRHATTRASEAGRNLGQRSDPPLTPEGHRLAARTGAAIAAELAALPHGAARIVTSPARRCRETAAALATALAVRAAGIQVEAGLWEIDYGAWEGMTQDQVRARDPELRAAYERDPYETRIPGGESGREVAERASGVLDALEQWLAAD